MISAGGATGPDGILAVNISNRFLDPEPLVDCQCRAVGKTDRRVDNDDDDSEDVFSASWVLATSPANEPAEIETVPGLDRDPRVPAG